MFLINTPVCTGCGECINVCPADAITLQNAKAVIAQSLCRQCGVCVNQCPVQAISEGGSAYVTQYAQRPPLSQAQPGILARVLEGAGKFLGKGSRQGGSGGGRGSGGGGRSGSGGGKGGGRGAGCGRGRDGRK